MSILIEREIAIRIIIQVFHHDHECAQYRCL